MDQVRVAIDNAALSSCQPATMALRRQAVGSGWSADVARTLRVGYRDGSFYVRSDDPRAENMEYGDGETVPAPAVRQFANRSEALEDSFLSAVEARVRGLL